MLKAKHPSLRATSTRGPQNSRGRSVLTEGEDRKAGTLFSQRGSQDGLEDVGLANKT